MENKSKMEYRYLGNSGLKVSVIGYGNFINNTADIEEKSYQLLKKAYDLGINFIDTAEVKNYNNNMMHYLILL